MPVKVYLLISVSSEVERQKEKVLVVEKGPTTRVDSRGRESLEVVTRSEFEILEALVNDLKKNVGPLPTPALPDNKQLRSELAKGSASLIDIMNAMQVKARVEAAEQAIGRMSELLTELAAVGALPEDFANRIVEVQFEPLDTLKPTDTIETHDAFELPLDTSDDKSRITPGKSVAIDPASIKSVAPRSAQSVVSPFKASVGMPSLASRLSTAPTLSSLPKVTHVEMDDALRSLKEDLSRNVNLIVSKASAAADMAVSMAKSVSEKLNVAVQLNTRVSTLHSLVSDYSEQLSGFDAGLSTQMQGFQDQIDQLRSDLKDGLTQLEQVNNNAETV
ncbi:uncharacterized protein LOC131855658, partial [Achroia grisella]|uniref:uncharacterized protein LOC131855658 n=1 Tax=Achroia grisella TaxID=688607 RepID=UPI0027D3439F